MNNGKICISVCAETVKDLLSKTDQASSAADIVEIRIDCLARPEFNALIAEPSTTPTVAMGQNLKEVVSGDSSVPRIITFRSSDQGGNRGVTYKERFDFWSGGVEGHIADVEEDLIDETFSWLWDNRICSFHKFTVEPIDFRETFERLFKTHAGIIKIAILVREPSDAIPLWNLLKLANKNRVGFIPVAMGEAGKWTRILGLAHGAYLTYAALESGNETAPGQITARDMIDVYRVKELDKQTGVYGIIAGDTTYTMSPYIHNAAFKAASMNSAFIPFQVSALDAFVTRMVRAETREIELNFKGFSVTNPHKQAIIKHLDHTDDAAAKIGAVNTIKIINEKLHGFNTDAHGFISPLKQRFGELKDARIAVVGAGGAARACVYTLKNAAADITIFAREINKAQHLANDFNVRADKLETGNSKPAAVFSDFDVVVNTTPLGTRGAYSNETIATAEQLNGVKLVYDLVYNPSETRLMREAKLTGAETIGGFDMLVAQASRQFEIWTGKQAPVDQMSSAARKRLYDS